ncbi:hypothetical protein GCM10022198_14420 [Klugiella xanthotipulae]|uniref:Uncharacterized protein n=1 Tax=Klugiella xanthotipulae TaxID=244735 RepID=A0A543I4P6_9MICO|nr:hypothetical protein [Klugiella xanthotipulae]TQM65531.1 hypothetical protein FB466_0335 [Klugiella xanthotipulae]
MPGNGELYPPGQYGIGWLYVALAVIALGIGLYLLVSFLTRPKNALRPVAAVSSAPPLVGPEMLNQLRYEYLAQLDVVESRFRSGELGGRETNKVLSLVVRQFVNEYSGIEAPVMTLSDLMSQGVNPVLLDAVGRHYYPSVFRRSGVIDPLAGLEAARRVVTTWH